MNDPQPLGYADALGELERILAELEASDVDVDQLADRVARATELIALCRDRIGDRPPAHRPGDRRPRRARRASADA